jgi:hypothetical protein
MGRFGISLARSSIAIEAASKALMETGEMPPSKDSRMEAVYSGRNLM